MKPTRFLPIFTLLLVGLTLGLIAASPHQTATVTPTLTLAPSATPFLVDPVATPVPVDVPASEPVTLPAWAEMLVFALVTYVTTKGLQSITRLLPKVKNLEGQAAAITAAVVYIVVAVVNALLAMIPAEFTPLILGIFGIVGSYGVHDIIKALQPKPGVTIDTTGHLVAESATIGDWELKKK